MATQHPDHGSRPYWHSTSFISTTEEAKECFLCFADLGIHEYKWDWEGKLVDESVLERLLANNFEYFKKFPLGKANFLTFRLPNPKVETEFRMSRALLGILSAAGLAKQVGLHSPPLFEVILPMTETPEEMLNIQEAFAEIASLKHPLNKFDKNLLRHIEIIPLFEQVDTIINSTDILERYLAMHKTKFGFTPKYIRPYVARSDPALNSGLVPTVVGIKIALSRYTKFTKRYNIKLFPVIGVGTLPFRGGINPITPKDFIQEYKGIRTTIIQSAFRYDFPRSKVKSAIKLLNKELPKGKAVTFNEDEEVDLIKIIKPFEDAYQSSIAGIAPLVNKVAGFIPKRRERVQHIGLFGYNRGVGGVKLPRAISFTASLYSLGIPPELIGSGKGLGQAMHHGNLKLLETTYVNLKKDLTFAGRYLYKEGLENLAKNNLSLKNILGDVVEIEKYLGYKLGPKTTSEKQHVKISAQIHKALKEKKNITNLIEKGAILRKSMG